MTIEGRIQELRKGKGLSQEPLADTLAPLQRTGATAVDWQWVFGKLPDGDYRFQKTILFIRSPGDYDSFVLEQEFSIP